jgi:hypothetical protein
MDRINDDVQSSTRVYRMLAIAGGALLIVGWFEWLVR